MNLQRVNNRELIWRQEQLSKLKISTTVWIQKEMSFSPLRISCRLKFVRMTRQYSSCHQKIETVHVHHQTLLHTEGKPLGFTFTKLFYNWSRLLSTCLRKQALKLTTIWHSSLFAGLCIAVLLIHGRITAATLMHHSVGPLLFIAALTGACTVSSKRPHPPVSLSTYQGIIWNKFLLWLYFNDFQK